MGHVRLRAGILGALLLLTCATTAQAQSPAETARILSTLSEADAARMVTALKGGTSCIAPWAPHHLIGLDYTLMEASGIQEINAASTLALRRKTGLTRPGIEPDHLDYLRIGDNVRKVLLQHPDGIIGAPRPISEFRFFEQLVNGRTNDRGIFSPIDVDQLPDDLNPLTGPLHELSYIEVPTSELRLWQGPGLRRDSRNMLFTTRQGVEYFRFFIHPDNIEKLQPLIEEYGGLKTGEYAGFPSSSPRSYVMWPIADPSKISGEKLSLLREVGETRRVNPEDKLARSAAVNHAMSLIPTRDKTRAGFEYIPEPLQVMGPGLYYGNIHREMPPELITGEAKIVAGFGIFSKRPGQTPPLAVEMIERSGADPIEFVRDELIRPVIRTFVYLSFRQGLIGELHQQNGLHKLSNAYMPEDFFYVRDLDSFKSDLVLRAQRGLSLEPYLEELRPFKVLKLNKAGGYYDDGYVTYIRNDWGYMAQKLFESYRQRLGIDPEFVANRRIFEEVDRVFLEETLDAVGADVMLAQARPFITANREELEALFPRVNWDEPKLNRDQLGTLLERWSMRQIFGSTSRSARVAPFSVDSMARTLRSKTTPSAQPMGGSQRVLRREYDRLVYNYRASTRVDYPEGTTFELYNGGIIARAPNGQVHGIALLEPRDAGRDFYESVPYPRQAPGRFHARLWEAIDEAEADRPTLDIVGPTVRSVVEAKPSPNSGR